MRFQRRAACAFAAAGVAACLLLAPAAGAEDWPTWRGPNYDGTSSETGLVSSWSVEGENLIWHDEFIGRSTPVVFDGRACAVGRVGEDKLKQEIVACWSAETGERLWERRYNVYNSTVPFSRVGWAALEGDPETGYVFAQLVDGQFVALDRDGETVWERRLGEEFYRLNGYGGRTHTPLVDEDRVIISVIGMSWGEHAPPRHRYFAFDKRTGEVVWTSTPNPMPFEDANNQGTPTVGVIDGRRVIVGGGADGWIHAIDSRTGEPLWKFQFGLRSINITPIIDGDTVYVSQSEETIDTGRMGRVVALDGTGSGDVTQTAERWRLDDVVLSGFPSPLLHEGVLYLADNSANLHAVDAATGRHIWQLGFGTVGKASPVWADGKIYVPQVNGEMVIIEPGESSGRVLDRTLIEVEGGRHAEIYGSPAIAYGRIYLATEAGMYCIGDPERPFEVTPSARPEPDRPADPNAAPTTLQVVPAEAVVQAGDAISFRARALDGQGRVLREVEAEWSLDGLQGELEDGSFQTPPASGQTGKVVASFGGLSATARLRVAAAPPWTETFDSGAIPRHWIGAGRFQVTERGGDQRLHKAPAETGFQRGTIYVGLPSLSDYTVQADILGLRRGRRQPDIGIINSGYSMELLGPHQQVRVQSWAAERRMAAFAPFEWAPDTWYTMKLIVDYEDDKAIIRGRIWKTGDPEPDGWAIEVEDPLPIRAGSPGVTCDSGVDVFYDNVKVMSR